MRSWLSRKTAHLMEWKKYLSESENHKFHKQASGIFNTICRRIKQVPNTWRLMAPLLFQIPTQPKKKQQPNMLKPQKRTVPWFTHFSSLLTFQQAKIIYRLLFWLHQQHKCILHSEQFTVFKNRYGSLMVFALFKLAFWSLCNDLKIFFFPSWEASTIEIPSERKIVFVMVL